MIIDALEISDGPCVVALMAGVYVALVISSCVFAAVLGVLAVWVVSMMLIIAAALLLEIMLDTALATALLVAEYPIVALAGIILVLITRRKAPEHRGVTYKRW